MITREMIQSQERFRKQGFIKETIKDGVLLQVVLSGGVNTYIPSDNISSIADDMIILDNDNRALYDIILSDNIVRIGAMSFNDLDNLRSVEMSDSVNFIGTCAFRNCKNLRSVRLPVNIFCFKIRDRAFMNCINLESIIIPETITEIGDYAFYGCDRFKKIDLPDSIVSIGYYAFSNCRNLSEIRWPSSVYDIGQYIFRNCVNLQHITNIGPSFIVDHHDIFENCPCASNIDMSFRIYFDKDRVRIGLSESVINLSDNLGKIDRYGSFCVKSNMIKADRDRNQYAVVFPSDSYVIRLLSRSDDGRDIVVNNITAGELSRRMSDYSE